MRTHLRAGLIAAAVATALTTSTMVAASAATIAPRRPTLPVSVDSTGALAGSSPTVAMSADGRYVVFVSEAPQLPGGNPSYADQVYRRDMLTGRTSLVSASPQGAPADTAVDPGIAAISGDGRYVAFTGRADNLVPGGSAGSLRLFVRDLAARTTVVANLRPDGQVGENAPLGYQLSMSADGRYLAFASAGSDLVAGDTNSQLDVFRRDLVTGRTALLSRTPAGTAGDGASGGTGLSMSADGRYVAFDSEAPDLLTTPLPGMEFPARHVFVRDVPNNKTQLVDRTRTGGVASVGGPAVAISGDGRYVAFHASTDAGPGPQGGLGLFRRDLRAGRTERVTLSGSGLPQEADQPRLSFDGRYIAFIGQPGPDGSDGSGFVSSQGWVRDMVGGTERRFTALPDGSPIGVNDVAGGVFVIALSGDGRFAGYATRTLGIVGNPADHGPDDGDVYRVGPLR